MTIIWTIVSQSAPQGISGASFCCHNRVVVMVILVVVILVEVVMLLLLLVVVVVLVVDATDIWWAEVRNPAEFL
jgi:hypothetical protein